MRRANTRFAALFRNAGAVLPHHLVRVLVETKTLVRRLLEHLAFGPAAKLDLGDELWLYPVHATLGQPVGKGTRRGLERRETLSKFGERRAREAAAHATGVAEPPG